jgi:putative aldouronate transport system substrate-binding protein
MLQRILPALLAAALAQIPLWSGPQAEKPSGDKPAAATASGSPQPIELPIVKQPLTLTFFRSLDAKVASSMKSQEEQAAYRELEKRTGIKVRFLHPPVGQDREQFNLMIASGDLPDMIFWSWQTLPAGPAGPLADKVIIPLNDPIAKYGPNLSRIYADNPEAKRQAMLDDGTKFAFPFLQLDDFLRAGGPIIRKDWLDKLGLANPKTVDDWYAMLKAFKSRDPNGNGKPDELPLVAMKGNALESITSFTAPWGVIQGFYQDKGVVKFGPVEKGFADYLAVMNKWYAEGLLDADFPATDAKSFDAKVTGGRGGAYIGRINNTFGRYLTLVRPKDPAFSLTGASWPVGPAGRPFNIRADMVAIAKGDGAAITTKNKSVRESTQWLDYHYSPEGHMLMNFGIEGESYKMDKGYPRYSDLIMKNPQGLAVIDAIARYSPAAFSGSMIQDRRYFEQTLSFPEQQSTIEIWAAGGDISLLLPPITPTIEESKKITAVMNDVNTYVAEMSVKFIMGAEPLARVPDFVANLKKMGVDDITKVQQAALDRYNKRK